MHLHLGKINSLEIWGQSGHGPDGYFIDETTKTIYLAEAKSSVNGVAGAKSPSDTAADRMDKWRVAFESNTFANVDADTKNSISILKNAIRADYKVKGLVVKVEVPRVNSSNLYDLGAQITVW